MRESHRKRLAHREMIAAYTTAAVINFSFCPPESPIDPQKFMPNYRAIPVAESKPKFTEDEVLEWQARVANLAAEMKRGGGPMLDEIQRLSDG